jgi:hypothetical protein
MTTPHFDHSRWDELAAGYALDALEPDEELEFTTHLADCARCVALLDQHEFVAAQLGALAVEDDAAAPEWSSIRDGIIDAAPPSPSSATNIAFSEAEKTNNVTLDETRAAPRADELAVRRRSRRPALLSAAAGVVLLAAAGVIGWQVSGSSSTPASVAACRHDNGCSVVALRAGSREAAVALVASGQVRVQPLHMPAVPAGQVYVLWQLPKSGSPQPIGEFRDASGETSALPLVATYGETAAFAISIESDAKAPTSPSKVMALGQT